MKGPERPERRVVEQFGPEQGRADAVADPDVCPPPGVRRFARLDGVLVRLGHDRRDVVDARVMRPRHLHPDAITDRDPVPVAGRAPPPLWRGSDPGVQVVIPRAVLKDPVGHLSLPLRLSDGSRPVIVPHGGGSAEASAGHSPLLVSQLAHQLGPGPRDAVGGLHPVDVDLPEKP